MQPISFLPQDKIDQGIQNLGETLSKINESRIARKQQQIESFKSLIDVSLQGIKNGHYEEAMKDLDNLNKESMKIYSNAENENRGVNGMESLKLSNLKKDLVYKTNVSKAWMDNYTNTLIEAGKLEQKGKLDPESKKQIEALKDTKEPIMNAPFASSYLREIYNTTEMAAVEKAVEDGINVSMTSTRNPDGSYNVNNYRDPETIKAETKAKLLSDPEYMRTLAARGLIPKGETPGQTADRISNQMVNKFTGLKEEIKKKPSPPGGYAPRSEKPIWFTHDDGTMTSSPTNDTPRNINGVLTRPAGDRTLKQNGVITYPMQEFKATPRYGNIYNGKKLSDKLSDADNILTGNLFKDKTYQDLKNYDEDHKDRWKKGWVDVTHNSQESDAYGQWWGETKESTRGNAKPVKPSGTKTSAKGGVIDLTTF